jgi:hypothetical protein
LEEYEVGRRNNYKKVGYISFVELFYQFPAKDKIIGGYGGEFEPFPILLEIENGGRKPPRSFKFKPSWLEEERFTKNIKEEMFTI